jgi:hypothetical protein
MRPKAALVCSVRPNFSALRSDCAVESEAQIIAGLVEPRVRRLPCRLFDRPSQNLASPAFRVAAGETLLLAQGQRQLFVDDAGIEQQIGVERRFYPPRALSARPILTRAFRGFIYPDPSGSYRLYYTSGPIRPGTDQLFTMRMAQSRDGIAWEVPDLNVMEFDPEYEEERNNVLLEDAILEGLFVEKTPSDGLEGGHPDRRQRPAHRAHGPECRRRSADVAFIDAAGSRSHPDRRGGSGSEVPWSGLPRFAFPGLGPRAGKPDLVRWSAARPN